MQATAPNLNPPIEAPIEDASVYVSDAERRTRVSILAGGIMIGASLAWCLSALITNLSSADEASVGHFGSGTGGSIGISTIADAPGGSVAYVATDPTGDLIAVSTSKGAGGSLAAPEAPVKDDLSPIQGDVNESGNFGSEIGGSIAPELVK